MANKMNSIPSSGRNLKQHFVTLIFHVYYSKRRNVGEYKMRSLWISFVSASLCVTILNILELYHILQASGYAYYRFTIIYFLSKCNKKDAPANIYTKGLVYSLIDSITVKS